MPYKSKEKRREYQRERYRQQKERQRQATIREKAEYLELSNRHSMGVKLSPKDYLRLIELEKKFTESEDYDDSVNEFYEIKNRVIEGGGELRSSDRTAIVSLPPPDPDVIPELLEGLSESAIEDIKNRCISPLAFGRGGTEVDLNGNVIKKEKEMGHWGPIIG